MSLLALAAVTALDNKAEELSLKRHQARAPSRSGVPRSPQLRRWASRTASSDTATLQAHVGLDELSNARGQGSPIEHAVAVIPRMMERAFASMAVLKRRKAAGTLLAGACRTVEEAWNTSRLQRRAELCMAQGSPYSQRFTQLAAPFVGYDAYMHTAILAHTCVDVASIASDVDDDILELLEFVASALALAAQPRLDDFPLAGEAGLVMTMKQDFNLD